MNTPIVQDDGGAADLASARAGAARNAYVAAVPSTLAYLRAWARPDAAPVTALETTYPRGAEVLPASLYRPRRSGRLPGWVVLHGLTWTGREHPSLIRFVRALAAAGNVVFVPDIPEWRALRVAPTVTLATIDAAVRTLHERAEVDPARVGLLGFSFGATHALVAAADPAIAGLLRGIAAWGGYYDVPRLFRFGVTGEHDLDGVSWRVRPDPYGAWLMIGNYYTFIPGHEADADVAAAAHALACEAGRVRAYAWEPVYDEMKQRLREGLPAAKREVFDIIAPHSAAPPVELEAGREIARQLSAAVLRVEPAMDPQPFLSAVRVPVVLAHGRDDRLVPFSETVRLSRALPPHLLKHCGITSLFAHSGGTNAHLGAMGLVREGTRFLTVLRRILHLL